MSDDLEGLRSECQRLAEENARLRQAISNAAAYFRGDLNASTLTAGFFALNDVLPCDERILAVHWGVASLEALQQAVANLAILVRLRDFTGFLKHEEMGGWKRMARKGESALDA